MDDTTNTREQPSIYRAAAIAQPSCFATSELGRFEASSLVPIVSSQRKLVFRGTWLSNENRKAQSAVAVLFPEQDAVHYGREVAALAQSSMLGVGPRIFDFAAHAKHGDAFCQTVVEEDAGISLEEAVFGHAPVPGTLEHPEWGRPLRDLESPQRALENNKILFDTFVQIDALHAVGLYHRDIRLANICVRRHGPDPQDIRATLIDHELGTHYRGTEVPAAARRYEYTLFNVLPRRINPNVAPSHPTSLMRDLGYLAALRFELLCERGIEEAAPNDLTRDKRPFFFYSCDGRACGHILDNKDDIAPLARKAGLMPVTDSSVFSPQVLEFIQKEIKHGGFLDACDMERIREREGGALEGMADVLAREVIYPRWREQRVLLGAPPEYDSFDDQPALLQESNRDQARDIPRKLQALGYRIEPLDTEHSCERVTAFSSSELEYLAYLEHQRWMDERMEAGWILGAVRDDERRAHPDLVPYDELSETSRELDRSAVNEIISILETAGLGVYR